MKQCRGENVISLRDNNKNNGKPMRIFIIGYMQKIRALQRNARLFLLSNALITISTSALGVLYSLFLLRLGFNTQFQSNLLVMGVAGAAAGFVPSLLIARVYTIRKLLIWSNIIGGIGAAVQLFIPQQFPLLISTFFIGASAVIYVILTPPLLAEASDESERTHLFSLNASLGYITAVGGSLIGGALPVVMQNSAILQSPIILAAKPYLVSGPLLPIQLALFAAGCIAVPSLIPLALMDDARMAPRVAETRAAGEQPFKNKLRVWMGEGIRLFKQNGIWRFVLYQSLLGLGAGLFLTYMSLYFEAYIRVSVWEYGVIAALTTVSLGIVSLFAPLIAEKMGSVRGVIIFQALSLLFLVSMALLRAPIIVALAYIIRSSLMNVGQPAVQSYMMSITAAQDRAALSSALNISWQILFAVGGWQSGYLLRDIGYPATFLGAAVCYGAALVFLLPLAGGNSVKRRRGARLTEATGQTQAPAKG